MPSATAERPLEAKLERLREILTETAPALVAFSGGVDSSFLLRFAADLPGNRPIALTTVSPTNPEEDTEDAAELARELGLEHVVVHANELEIPGYRENPVDRCYFCKTNLYEIAGAEATRRGIRWILDGVNTDDLGDYRPGLRAAEEREVRHPLAEAGLSKEEIRTASRALGLRSWDRPSSPCLSSRFPYGTPITPEGLTRVARAEKLLRAEGFRTCRVRHQDQTARIEVPLEDLPRLLEPVLRARVVAGMREIGYRVVSVDLEGFRSGSLNRGIASPPPQASR